jgi:hypothetical protein
LRFFIYAFALWRSPSNTTVDPEEYQILRSSRLTHEHPEILEVDSVSAIDDEISSIEGSLILLSLIGIEMMWDRSTPKSYP